MPEPLVSVVTPSYNMAEFLPETIESVLSQDYRRVEYIVMDGGSSDGTIDILKRYGDRLRYVSAPDGGAAEAINRGCRSCHGSIFAWLNADDTYLPGAISAAVRRFQAVPQAGVVYGDAYWTDPSGGILRPYPTRPFDRAFLGEECYICQPASFFRKSAFEQVGMLDSTLHSAFDYDLWFRLSEHYAFVQLKEYLATSRMHRSSKTLGNRSQMYLESFGVLKRHVGYVPFQRVHSYSCYLVDGRDQFYEPLQPSVFKYLLSLPLGCWQNPRKMKRFAREWLRMMTLDGFIRWFKDIVSRHTLNRRPVPPARRSESGRG
jgi:glycosyltransferase involved in cell wall biosynthesis